MNQREECVSCSGDGELAATGDSLIDHHIKTASRIRGLHLAIGTAREWIHRYRAESCVAKEEWRKDSRIVGCLEQIIAYRASIKVLRASLSGTFGHYAWCIACKGVGLASIEADCCGADVTMATIDRDALECADVLVHIGHDTGHRFFDHDRGVRNTESVWP